MQKSISKKKIIEALKTEPLAPGTWVRLEGDKTHNDPTCTVCAVGAVLRKAKFRNFAITQNAHRQVGNCYFNGDDYKAALKERNYLGALSAYFETICPESGATPAIRRRLVTFVTKYFPEKVSLTAR